ncbi:hypothetical protein KM043_001503 [Ampulex compressa]|nr:hypothetical protein KM043_001503 [Ampulex compressa]
MLNMDSNFSASISEQGDFAVVVKASICGNDSRARAVRDEARYFGSRGKANNRPSRKFPSERDWRSAIGERPVDLPEMVRAQSATRRRGRVKAGDRRKEAERKSERTLGKARAIAQPGTGCIWSDPQVGTDRGMHVPIPTDTLYPLPTGRTVSPLASNLENRSGTRKSHPPLLPRSCPGTASGSTNDIVAPNLYDCEKPFTMSQRGAFQRIAPLRLREERSAVDRCAFPNTADHRDGPITSARDVSQRRRRQPRCFELSNTEDASTEAYTVVRALTGASSRSAPPGMSEAAALCGCARVGLEWRAARKRCSERRSRTRVSLPSPTVGHSRVGSFVRDSRGSSARRRESDSIRRSAARLPARAYPFLPSIFLYEDKPGIPLTSPSCRGPSDATAILRPDHLWTTADLTAISSRLRILPPRPFHSLPIFLSRCDEHRSSVTRSKNFIDREEEKRYFFMVARVRAAYGGSCERTKSSECCEYREGKNVLSGVARRDPGRVNVLR